MTCNMRPQQYRRVKEDEEEYDEPRTYGSSSSSCILSCVLLLLILISIALALGFFIHPWRTPMPTTSPPTPKTTPVTTTTFAPTVSEQNQTEGIFSSNGTMNETLEAIEENILESDTKLKGQLIDLIRKSEKFMEKWTGMEGELLVPVFMLLCFLTSVSIVSLCCCIMTKRREARRRQLFGKIITDLQTGDSKTVLLNHSDLDD